MLVFVGICPPVCAIRRFGAATPPATRPICDLMVRTGLRLAEQASLTLFEVPDIDIHRAYAPTRLPSAIAKNGSGRRIYIPATVLRDLWDYIRFDRAELIEQASRRGTYDRMPDKLLVEDPEYAVDRGGRPSGVGAARSRLSIRGSVVAYSSVAQRVWSLPTLWLNHQGLPVMPGTWQSMFGDANDRCRRHEVWPAGPSASVAPHLCGGDVGTAAA